MTQLLLSLLRQELFRRAGPCELCLLGTPRHPTADDLHVILVHDGVRFVECTRT